ncbi:disintegrin and metalloproteinase domain-containing protein 10 [Lingula anatina]|uniref:ADAM10 endopeptidase n=1 Tax=Lingula anatina TaxID=7574 RepID=A0A1S3H064_LINAN|nr:disintegrin and metalloproteinase domain-containing protein 10 [Lingula anatina]|eukprot:XP_013379515.1 disintegrin and metalloproteinase domain-containing protein 10 [Lingula anatina]
MIRCFEVHPNTDMIYHGFYGCDTNSLKTNCEENKRLNEFQVIRLEVKVFEKTYFLRLVINHRIFSGLTVVKIADKQDIRQLKLNKAEFYHGFVEGDATSWAYGRLHDGMFDGSFIYKGEQVYIEKASKYILNVSKEHSKDYIVYKASDISYDNSHVRLHGVHVPRTRFSFSTYTKIQKSKRSTGTENTCSLHLVADHTFFQNIGKGDATTTINEMVYHVTEVDKLFRGSDFNGDGEADNIGIAIGEITIYGDKDAVAYKLADTSTDVFTYLYSFSEYNFDNFCGGVVFTHRDFADGVLGLAWIADSSKYGSAGGICQQSMFMGPDNKMYNFNTAMVSFLNFGQVSPRKVSVLTLAHELGHNFGSEHDNTQDSLCSPGDPGFGNYLMYPTANDGQKPNHWLFSQCSKDYINPVLQNKASCFIANPGPVCGNGIVEDGEECDCGSASYCAETDPCCTPPGGLGYDTGCTIRKSAGYSCSPLVSECCTTSCVVVPLENHQLCQQATDCTESSYCDGVGANCPEPQHEADGTLCNQAEKTCVSGQCIGTICSGLGLEECQCVGSDSLLCRLCCYNSSEPQSCHPAENYHTPSTKIRYRDPGKGCNNYTGYCDRKHKCIEVDFNAALKRLSEVFSPKTSEIVKEWFTNYWYYLLSGVGVLAFLIAVFMVNCKKKEPVSTMAFKAGKLQRVMFEVERQKRLLKQRLNNIDSAFEQKMEAENQMDFIVAVSRMCTFFPKTPKSVIIKTVRTSSSEEFAVKQLLIKGYPMRRLYGDNTNNSNALEQTFKLLNLELE